MKEEDWLAFVVVIALYIFRSLLFGLISFSICKKLAKVKNVFSHPTLFGLEAHLEFVGGDWLEEDLKLGIYFNT